jgi:hypothetical protein
MTIQTMVQHDQAMAPWSAAYLSAERTRMGIALVHPLPGSPATLKVDQDDRERGPSRQGGGSLDCGGSALTFLHLRADVPRVRTLRPLSEGSKPSRRRAPPFLFILLGSPRSSNPVHPAHPQPHPLASPLSSLSHCPFFIIVILLAILVSCRSLLLHLDAFHDTHSASQPSQLIIST